MDPSRGRTRYKVPLPEQRYSAYSRELFRAAVYGWALYKTPPDQGPSVNSDPYAVYVGEAENLPRRLQGYLRPGSSQQTNKRIKEYLERELSRGSTIELQRFRFRDFHILMSRATETYELISVNALCNPFKRKLVENIGIIVHDARYCEILNAAPDPIERRRQKALKLTKSLGAMTPEKRASFYARYGLKF